MLGFGRKLKDKDPEEVLDLTERYLETEHMEGSPLPFRVEEVTTLVQEIKAIVKSYKEDPSELQKKADLIKTSIEAVVNLSEVELKRDWSI